MCVRDAQEEAANESNDDEIDKDHGDEKTVCGGTKARWVLCVKSKDGDGGGRGGGGQGKGGDEDVDDMQHRTTRTTALERQ